MRILVVDDEPTAALLLVSLLAPYGACDTAADAERAVAAIAAALDAGRPYDLVCLDVLLGDDDGRAVLRRLRAMERAAGLDPDRRARALMTTVVDDPDGVASAFDAECDGYLIKPVTREKLAAKLGALGLGAAG